VYDVIVLGGGPAGYVTAVRLVGKGFKVALVERKYLGGECTNWGCIPSKALIDLSNNLYSLKALSKAGLSYSIERIDYSRLLKHVERAVIKSREGIKYLLSDVDIFYGVGRVKDVNTVEVLNNSKVVKELTGKNIVVATGTEPNVIPSFKFDGERILSNREFFELKSFPNSIAIIGAGAIGCEISSALAKLGVEVHLIEIMNKILPEVDKDLSDVVHKHLVKQGVKIYTSAQAKYEGVTPDGKEVIVKLNLGSDLIELKVEKVLIAAGRKYNTSGLGLENVGVELDSKGVISVNEFMRTTVPNIYAAGDVTGPPLLAHKAFREGMIVADAIAGVKNPLPRGPIPMVIYTEPEVGLVGLSETQASKAGIAYKVFKFPFIALGRDYASVKSTPEGFVKILIEENTRKMLGAAIVGNAASEVIHLFGMGLTLGLDLTELRKVVTAHPTYSEVFSEVVNEALGEPLHGPRK